MQLVCRAVRLMEQQQEQYFNDLENLEHEVEVTNQRTRLDVVKKKLDELVKDTNDAALVRSSLFHTLKTFLAFEEG